jgi:glycine/D-amino acid oxidase-like deaminating enzyme
MIDDASPRLPGSCDIAIIGGGVVGLCIAWFLAEAGEQVVLIDDGRHAGSTANAGSLHVQMQSRFMRLYPDLAEQVMQALPLYPRAVNHWVALSQRLPDIELKITGGLMVAETPQQVAFLAAKCERERRLGLLVGMLDRADLEKIAPYLGASVIGAEICENEGKLNPLLANQGIRRQAVRHGSRIHSGLFVENVATDSGHFLLRTARGILRSRRLIVAAAAGSSRLAGQLGIRLPASPEPLHMNITEATEPLIRHLVQHADRQITLKQLGAGQIVIGGGWPAHLAGPNAHPAVELASIVGNVSLAQHIVPAIRETHLLRSWAGINTAVDGRAVLGGIPSRPGLYFAIPGDAGYTLGPLCARLVSDLVLDRDPEIDIAPYSATRFGAA